MVMVWLAGVFWLASLCSAETWSGWLVDSRCYDAEERNVNPTDTLTAGDRDKNMEIRQCAPKAKTKSFGVVESDGSILKLDPAGHEKTAGLVRTAGKKSRYFVNVSGELRGSAVKVDSISLAK